MAHFTIYTNTHRHRSAAEFRYDCSTLAVDETVILLPRDHGRRFDHHHYGAFIPTRPAPPNSSNQNDLRFSHHFLRRHAALGIEDETLVLEFPEQSATATEETIAKHIKSRLVRDGGTVDGGICVVCQDDLVKGIAIARLDCGHSYHESCIRKWLTLNNTCPLCKASVIVSS